MLGADVYHGDGSVAWRAGTVPTADVTLAPGMKLGAGTVLRAETLAAALTWPKGVALPAPMTASGVLALARGALIPAMTKIELPDDKPVNLRPKTGEFQGANWALAPMLPQGATSWSLQLTAGADLGSADPRAVDPASRGSLVLADSHASTRMKIVPGGVGLVYAPNDLGYPVGEPVDPDWVSDCDLFAGLCVTDPKRIKRTWTQAGSDMFGTEVGTPVQEELVVFATRSRRLQRRDPADPRHRVGRAAGAHVQRGAHRRRRPGRGGGRRSAHGHALWLLYGGHAIDGVAPRRRRRSVRSRAAGTSSIRPRAPSALRCWVRNRTTTARPTARTVPGIPSAAATWTSSWAAPCPGTPGRSSRRPTARRRPAPASATGWAARVRRLAGLMVDQLRRLCRAHGHQYGASSHPYIVGFTGFGTLGGGNLSIAAGGDAGIARARGLGDYGAPEPRSRAPGRGRGRHRPRRARRQPGADRRRRFEAAAGRRPEPGPDASQYATQYRTNRQKPDLDGMVTNLRGAIQIEARAIGGSRQLFRRDAVAQPGLTGDAMDPRPINPFVPTLSSASGGITLVPGDSAVYLETLGDLVLSGVSDAGRVRVLNTSIQTPGNGLSVGGGQSWFSLGRRPPPSIC